MREILKELLEERVKIYVSPELRAENTKTDRKVRSLKDRKAEIVNVKAKGYVQSVHEEDGVSSIKYDIHFKYLIKQRGFMYLEEEIEHREALARGDILFEDREVPYIPSAEPADGDFSRKGERISYKYNRLKAVQYAERWWNEFNPAYKKFTDDCTSFISQCLRAGSAPMWGSPNRSKGWWYSGKSWSYSWAVAHALKNYLQSSSGLKTRKVNSPEQLKIGDIICYDFEGDGRFNHNTMVTGKDAYGEPLVNAHTTNSRMRYWKYEDSSAYTPNIRYAFFTIID
ncbi:amidase domain-containing protein [Peribacillus kribbensis]|uniref:amidase domain-containing protein n=1 Tax=Peribacillus kribbensis TaxID=356658 RepID=UPI00047DC7D6|nr:amidase domain-containing protein [Peribacillus kribbensis]